MAAHLDESARGRSRQTYERTREHRIVPPAVSAQVEAWVEPEAARPVASRTIEPRLLRLGALAAAAVLIVPVAVALADGGDDSGGEVRSADVPEAAAMTPADVGDETEPADTGVPVSAAAVLDPAVLEAEAANDDDDGGAGSSGEKGRPNSGEKGRPNDESDAPDEPECAGMYTVIAGDYWLRFVESSGASLDEWLAANDAEPETQMYVGDELCIPAGAEAPDPPEQPTDGASDTDVAASSTTAAPTETVAAETTTTAAAAPTTTATTTTTTTVAAPAAPAASTTTLAPAPASPTTPAGVEALIREIWPDNIEERALTIARRESSLRPDAYNGWCCYGIFQIYFEANRSFLARHGVTSAQQLLNARTNVTVAYELYKASGWDPWSQTDPGG